MAVILLAEGVIQTWGQALEFQSITGAAGHIPQGPVASQMAIKHLASSGGGYFAANSAHPFENPTVLSNFVEMMAMLLLPTAVIFAFRYLVDSFRQAMALFNR